MNIFKYTPCFFLCFSQNLFKKSLNKYDSSSILAQQEFFIIIKESIFCHKIFVTG